MDTWSLFIAIFCGIGIAQSCFLSAYLLVNNRKQKSSTVFIGFLLIGLALRIAKSYAYYVVSTIPDWFVALGAGGLWIVGPSFLFFTLSSKARLNRKWAYLHYLPALFIFLLTSSVATDLLIVAYHGGAVHFMTYLLISLYVFKRHYSKAHAKRFYLFASSLGTISLIFLIQTLVGGIAVYTMGSFFTLIILYLINYVILQDQRIIQIREKRTKSIQPDQQEKVISDLSRLFEQEKAYRQKGLTLTEVAKSLNHPAYQISHIINQHYGLKFNQYVNKYRVEEVKQRLADLVANDKIEVIAEEVGFSSTSSLYQAFKRETNATPQAYRKQLSLS